MFDSFKHHPVGEQLPDHVHAVSCSLPTMDDVIAYEEKDPIVIASLKAGYPRFTRHRKIREITLPVAKKLGIQEEFVFILASSNVISQLNAFLLNFKSLNCNQLKIFDHDFLCIIYTKDSEMQKCIHSFLQHTGASISSRQAEDYLIHNNNHSDPELLEKSDEYLNSIKIIKQVLANKHKISNSDDIFIGKSGMSCFFAAYLALDHIQKQKKKSIWIQLGWLYIDTIELLKTYAQNPGNYVFFADLLNLDVLQSFIEENHKNIAGLVTESPTNPLVQTMDIQKLYNQCKKYDIAVILDPTIASPHNVRCLEFSDITINSLTKYTAHKGNVMLGSLVLNKKSTYYEAAFQKINETLIEPYDADVIELSKQITNYDKVVNKMNSNNIALVNFLENHSSIKRVYHAYSNDYAQNYKKITWQKNSPGCLLSFELNIPIRQFYDKIKIAKGPSLGQDFTILCPFIYLAHYDLVSSESGRKILKQNHIPIDLIRVSVGTEDPEKIINAFDAAL